MTRSGLRLWGAAHARLAYHWARERWPALVFIVLLTTHRATQWGHFAVPAPDFFDFEDTAQALAAGHLPAQFQRAPLYPALMAIVSPFVGGDRPALGAAQGLNLALAAAALLVMYELCVLFVGRWALLVVMLSGLQWSMAYVTVHPLCEPTLLAALLAALYLDASGRRGKYLAAGLAAATRYEGLALIAALALCDLRRKGNLARVGMAASLAAGPTLLWLAADALSPSRNPYVAAIAGQAPAGLEFVRSVGMSAIGFVPVQMMRGALAGSIAWRTGVYVLCGAVAALALAGAMVEVGRRPRQIGPSLAFGALYCAIHLIYPAANTRFALPLLWLAHSLAISGALSAAHRARAHLAAQQISAGRDSWRRAAAAVVGLACGLGAVWAAPRGGLSALGWAATAALGVFGSRRSAWPRLLVAIPVFGVAAAGASSLSCWYLDREGRWWAELESVARWCETPEAEKVCLAATTPALSVLREISVRPRARFYDLGSLHGAKTRAGLSALPREVTHLLWSSTDTPPAGRAWCAALSRRYGEQRERLVPTGRWFVRQVAAGRSAGWRVCARFEARGQQAVIYVRESAVWASAPAEARR